MIVVVLLIGAGLGWMARIIRSASDQRDAVVAIRKSGGLVLYDWQWKNGDQIHGGALWWPKWIVDALGVDYFSDAIYVGITGSDSVLVHIGCLG